MDHINDQHHTNYRIQNQYFDNNNNNSNNIINHCYYNHQQSSQIINNSIIYDNDNESTFYDLTSSTVRTMNDNNNCQNIIKVNDDDVDAADVAVDNGGGSIYDQNKSFIYNPIDNLNISSSTSPQSSIRKDNKWGVNETIFMLTSWEKHLNKYISDLSNSQSIQQQQQQSMNLSMSYNKIIYSNIQVELKSFGFDRSLDQIKRKISQLKTRYFKELKQTSTSSSKSPTNRNNKPSSNWQFFKQMDRILRRTYFNDKNKNIKIKQEHEQNELINKRIRINENEIKNENDNDDDEKILSMNSNDHNSNNNNNANNNQQSVSTTSISNTFSSSLFENRIITMISNQNKQQQLQYKYLTDIMINNQKRIEQMNQSINILQQKLDHYLDSCTYNNNNTANAINSNVNMTNGNNGNEIHEMEQQRNWFMNNNNNNDDDKSNNNNNIINIDHNYNNTNNDSNNNNGYDVDDDLFLMMPSNNNTNNHNNNNNCNNNNDENMNQKSLWNYDYMDNNNNNNNNNQLIFQTLNHNDLQ